LQSPKPPHFTTQEKETGLSVLIKPPYFEACLNTQAKPLKQALYLMNIFYLLLVGGLLYLNKIYALEITFIQVISYIAIIAFISHVSYFFTQMEVLTCLWTADKKLLEITPQRLQIHRWYLPTYLIEELSFTKDLVGPKILVKYRIPGVSEGYEASLYCRNILGLAESQDAAWLVEELNRYRLNYRREIQNAALAPLPYSELESKGPNQKAFTVVRKDQGLRFVYSLFTSDWVRWWGLVGFGGGAFILANSYVLNEYVLGGGLGLILLLFLAQILPNATLFIQKTKRWSQFLEKRVNAFAEQTMGLKSLLLNEQGIQLGRQKKNVFEPEQVLQWPEIQQFTFRKMIGQSRGLGGGSTIMYQIEIQTKQREPIVWGAFLDEKHVVYLLCQLLRAHSSKAKR